MHHTKGARYTIRTRGAFSTTVVCKLVKGIVIMLDLVSYHANPYNNNLQLHENSVGLYSLHQSRNLGVSHPVPACSGTYSLENQVLMAESLRCLDLRTRGGRLLQKLSCTIGTLPTH